MSQMMSLRFVHESRICLSPVCPGKNLIKAVLPKRKYYCIRGNNSLNIRGWSGGPMVLGKLPVPGRPKILITVGQGPIAFAAGAGGGGLDIFTLIYPFLLSPFLLEMV